MKNQILKEADPTTAKIAYKDYNMAQLKNFASASTKDWVLLSSKPVNHSSQKLLNIAFYLYSANAGITMIASFLSRFFVKFTPKNMMSGVVYIIAIFLLSLFLLLPLMFMIACIIFVLKDRALGLTSPIRKTYLHTFISGKISSSVLYLNNVVCQTFIGVSSLAMVFFVDIWLAKSVIGHMHARGSHHIFSLTN
jgi:hypothetical protein